MVAQPGQLPRQLRLFDLRLGRAPLVLKLYYRPARVGCVLPASNFSIEGSAVTQPERRHLDSNIARSSLLNIRCSPLCFDTNCTMLSCRSSGVTTMADERLDLPQGTLDLLILKALTLESLHGWAISERLQQISREALQVQQGSLYPALHRLERRGWIKANWAISENNRRAKYYELTRQGRKQLEVETQAWRKLAAAVGHVLDMA
jgi:PadR family transcriptional regulator PadR